LNDWNIERARSVYNIRHWSGGYFDINDHGHLTVCPGCETGEPGIDLFELSKEIRQAGLSLPVLVRFSGILQHRIDTLHRAFSKAIDRYKRDSRYTSVYPIKVNQQHSVVEEIVRYGGERIGLEAGSKPELMVVLAQAGQVGGTIVCNGYKDSEFIRLALIGRALGHRIYIVVEKLSELELIIRTSEEMGVTPLIGLRVRLASIGAGNWQNTGGDKSKFGLSAPQVLQAVQRLRETDLLSATQMLHFHMGSQIPHLADIRTGLEEGARFYAELQNQGADIKVVNVGGGLGVDYEGTRSRSFSSTNYSVEDYADAVVAAIHQVADTHGLPFPELITEAGRAMVAHHAMLMTNVVETESKVSLRAPEEPMDTIEPVRQLWDDLQSIESRSVVEIYQDAQKRIAETHRAFSAGEIGLAQRARAEEIFFTLCRRIRDLLSPGKRGHRDVLDDINDKLADKYFCNFSLFQSLPDAWAIQQVFPVVPLNRLNEAPTQRGVLEDITCDSDGRLDYYPDAEGVESTLPLHTLKPNEPYILGIFLVGAYQEILGDMHNLFGDTDSVHVAMTKDGHRLTDVLRGDDVGSVLRYVHFDPEALLESYKIKIKAADLEPDRGSRYLHELAEGLRGYTYLED
jgi:arginine decarboxylase